jgi:hypothetical protein
VRVIPVVLRPYKDTADRGRLLWLLYFAAVRQPAPHHRSCRRRLRRDPPAPATATKKVPPTVIGRLEAKGLRGGCSRKARANAIPIRAAVSPIAHKSSTCNHVLRVLSQEVIGSSCTRHAADHSPLASTTQLCGGDRPSRTSRRVASLEDRVSGREATRRDAYQRVPGVLAGVPRCSPPVAALPDT